MSTVLGAERVVTSTVATRVRARAVLMANLQVGVAAAVATEALTAVVTASGVHLAVGDPGGDASSVVAVNAGACAIAIAMVMVLGSRSSRWRSTAGAVAPRSPTSVRRCR